MHKFMSSLYFLPWKQNLIWQIFLCRIMETAPTLPDFALALKPDDFQLPPVDLSWNNENINK